MSDAFDALLISTASVLKRSEATADSYGIGDPTFVVVGTNVPCRVSRMSGREFRVGKKDAIRTNKVFLRPWSDPVTHEKLNHNHWFLIDGEYYDIQHVDNPSRLDHHYEAVCNIVEI